jgi:hypothetical protein
MFYDSSLVYFLLRGVAMASLKRKETGGKLIAWLIFRKYIFKRVKSEIIIYE